MERLVQGPNKITISVCLQLTSDAGVTQCIGERFALRADMLPSYIPTKVAQKILFVGESVEMFEKIDVNGRQQRHQGRYIIITIISHLSLTFGDHLHI